VWRSRAELELATVEWLAWFNHDRLHGSLGDIPPVEFETLHALEPAGLSIEQRSRDANRSGWPLRPTGQRHTD
jgi:hypothetical protein